MVDAQYRLLAEGLAIKHVRLIIGNSMGGMHVWLWGEKYPEYMDALVPMASQPPAMASRNWMLRRIMLESIRQDPEYAAGNYTKPLHSVGLASVFFGIATAGGTLNYQKQAPTRALADKLVDARLAAATTADANDFIWQWESSGDYDAAPELEKIEASLLLINAADDERNPPETKITDAAIKRVKNGRIYLIPASEQTSGHSTTGNAKVLHATTGRTAGERPPTRNVDYQRRPRRRMTIWSDSSSKSATPSSSSSMIRRPTVERSRSGG